MSIYELATCGSENTIRAYAPHFATVWPANTQLSGTIPDSFGLLTALTILALESTHISGTIPDSLGNLTALTTLWLGEYIPDRYLWF
eukprot:SAG31_NODE_16136_length_721_cov_1.504823_1_plen_87_part_00